MADPVKPGETPAATPPATPPASATPAAPTVESLQKLVEDQTKTVADLSAKLAEVTKESIERRQRLKPLETLETALRTALGVPEGDVNAKVTEAVASQQSKMKLALAKGTALAHAAKAGVVDPELAVAVMDLSQVEVDLEKLSVKPDAIDSQLESMRKVRPFLFTEKAPAAAPPAPAPAPGVPTPTPARPPAGGGEGGTPGEQYDRLMAAGRKAEAMQLYLKHRAEIGRHIETKLQSQQAG